VTDPKIRLYNAADLAPGADIPLTDAQAHYLGAVMRQRPGDAVLAFNGRDGEWVAEIESLGRRNGALRAVRQRRPQVFGPDLDLLFAPVKRAPIDLIVQKAVELGARRLRPVLTDRTIVARVKTERLQAVAVEAAEQCGRLDAPPVAEPQKLADVISDWPAERRLLFCDEAGDDPGAEWGGPAGRAAPVLEALGEAAPGPWAVLIGPEGGFTPEERARLRGLPFVTTGTLGPRILRSDTAVFAALALWQAALGDFKSS